MASLLKEQSKGIDYDKDIVERYIYDTQSLPYRKPSKLSLPRYFDDHGAKKIRNIHNALDTSIQDDEENVVKCSCCSRGPKAWCCKYFWEGQSLDESANGSSVRRRLLAVIIPAIIFHICWWGITIQYNLWYLFPEKYYMSLCMVFGSIVAGMTSEGGGAIAFPVMTLAFQISPSVARDFSLMIQSCGMSAAAISIFVMKINLEWHSLALCSTGGAVGIVFGFHMVDPYLSPELKKMAFVSIWFSFAFALFLLNRLHKRRTFKCMPKFCKWKGFVLLLTGLIGGIFSSFAGSGLDICSFSILTLLFRVSEKVATPTSVVLMAGNTLVGFYWRGVMMTSTHPISRDAWDFLLVCVPVVVIGAPIGSFLGTHFHRQVLAALVYIIDVAALVGAFVLVPLTPELIGTSIGIIAVGFLFFLGVTFAGHRIMLKIPQDKENNAEGKDIRNKLDLWKSVDRRGRAISKNKVKHNVKRKTKKTGRENNIKVDVPRRFIERY